LKEYKLNKQEGFLKGWYINPEVCDEIINYFEDNKKLQKLGNLDTGFDKNKKTSTDISVSMEDMNMVPYSFELKNCVEEYKKIFPALNLYLAPWSMKELINIQKYKPGEGFVGWHTENSNLISCHRIMAFMTYLNTVEENGETEWCHQKIKIKPEKGLTLIWPSDWTHLHRGCVAKKETKYIATGWFSYV
tara:strand:+ start:3126 stop:3695 length:570 start_codon:yes stop_codon:yes gene_type:complete